MNVAVFLDVSTKADTGPVPPRHVGNYEFAARPVTLDTLYIGQHTYWVQRVEMWAGENQIRVIVGRG